MRKIFVCPSCGMDITAIVEKEIRERAAKAGRAKSAKKSEASGKNALIAAQTANDKYTPEKRRQAAVKRKITMEAKKK